MRYTTALFGETANLFGEFAEGRPLSAVSGVNVELYDPAQGGAAVVLLSSGCAEISGARAGGFSTYYWPTSNIATQPTEQVEYLYVMRDTQTPRVHKGKIVLGGFTDESARNRYGGAAHIDPDGVELPTEASGLGTVTFGSNTITGGTGVDYAVSGFAAGQRVQVTDSSSNDGVTSPIVSVAGNVITFPASEFTVEGPTASVLLIAKTFIFDAGTDENPVTNLRDARQVADILNFTEYHVHGGVELEIDFPHDEWTFEGRDPDRDSLTFVAGSSCSGASFRTVGIYGTLSGGRISAERCILGAAGEGVSGLQGVVNECGLAGHIQIASDGILTALGFNSRDLTGVYLDMTAGAATVLAADVVGVFAVSGMATGDILGLACNGAVITIGPSNTGGTAQFGGVGRLAGSGGGVTIIANDLVGSGVIADAVWDEVLAGHLSAGSTGQKLAEIGSGVSTVSGFGAAPTAGAVADAVWDEAMSAHNVGGSFGRGVRQVKEGVVAIEADVSDGAPTASGFITDLTEATSEHYADLTLAFIGGTLTGQSRIITTYDGATKTVTFDEPFTEAPANGDAFIILTIHSHTRSQIADAVWDEALAGHLSAGSTGLELSGKAEPGDSMALTGGAISGVADQVWDEAIAGHATSGTTGRNLWDARRHVTNDREIDRTTSPWEEVVYGDDGEEIQRATLSGGDASVAAITNTNRPQGVIVSKRHVVSGAS